MENYSESVLKSKSSEILIGISIISIFILFFIDKSNIYNYIFALINLGIIYKFFNQNTSKMFYYITLLFAIMGMTLGIHLKKYIGIDEQVNIYYIYLAIYIFIFIIDFFKSFKKEEVKNIFTDYINILFIIFAVYTFASFVLAEDKKLAIIKLLYYGVMFALVIMIVRENRTKEELYGTLRFLGVISCGMLIMGVFKIVTGIQLEANSSYLTPGAPLSSINPPFNRIPTLFFYNPNNYALVAVVILIAFSIYLVSNTKNNQLVIGTIIVLAEINIFFTRSRTGWIAVVITLIFISLVLLLKKNWKKAILILTPMIIFLVLFKGFEYIKSADFLYAKLGEMEQQVDENGEVITDGEIHLGNTGSINVRATLMADVLQGVIKEKNYLGFGPGNIQRYIKELDNTHRRYDPHCWWLEILGDFGVIGFLSFTLGYFLMALRLFITFLTRDDFTDVSLLSLALLATTSMLVFSPSSVFRLVPFWIVIGLALATSSQIFCNKRKKEGN